ncbi:MAG: radical SAM protein [Desulfamplus sp.]|nr:radical SAM protein [Desulfamplus sp.]
MIIPANVILEVSALCNLSCLGCALHGPCGFVKRPFGNMKKEVWEPVIKEMASWGKDVELTAHGGGEPLLNPQFRDILQFAATFPSIRTGFLANGMLLNESWVDFIINIKLNWIAVSIDGTDPETHDMIRKGSDLVRVENNLETLLRMKKEKKSNFPNIKLNMVAYDQIFDQQESFVEKWIDKVDSVMVSHYRNPPQSKRWPDITVERKPCPLLWSQAVVAWDGRLGLCCEDFNIDHSPGKVGLIDHSPEKVGHPPGKGVQVNSLLELWNGKEMSRIRELHTNGEYDSHPMCRVCDSWAEEYSRCELPHDKGYEVIKTPSQIVYSRPL